MGRHTADFAASAPTAHQAEFLRHLVNTGKPWVTPETPSRGKGLLPSQRTSPRRVPSLRLPSGIAVKLTTVRVALEEGWLLGLDQGAYDTPGWRAIITPAGREALARAQPDRPAGWDDDDRIDLRQDVAEDGACHGPLEADYCTDHPHDLEVFRWVWPAPGAEDSRDDHRELVAGGDAEIVIPCPRCLRILAAVTEAHP